MKYSIQLLFAFRKSFVLNANLNVVPDVVIGVHVVQVVVKKLLLNHLPALLLVMLVNSMIKEILKIFLKKIKSIDSFFLRCSFWRAHYDLKDVNENVVLSIIGPGCLCDGPYSCCCENKFTVCIIIFVFD